MSTYFFGDVEHDFRNDVLVLHNKLFEYTNFAKNEIISLANTCCQNQFTDFGSTLALDFKHFFLEPKKHNVVFSEIYDICNLLYVSIKNNQNLHVVFDKLELVIIDSTGKISYVPQNSSFGKPPIRISENDFYEVVLYIHLKTKISDFCLDTINNM